MADIRIEDRRFVMGREFDLVLFKPQSEEALKALELSASTGLFTWSGPKKTSRVLGVDRRIASGFAKILTDDDGLSLEYEDDQENEE